MLSIIDIIFPETANNNYLGHPYVIPAFWFLTIVSIAKSSMYVFKFDGGTESVAKIPLKKFPIEASETLIAFAAVFGLSQLLMSFVYTVILVRYKSLLPLGILLFTSENFFAGLITPVLGKKMHSEGPRGKICLFSHIFPLIGIILFWYSCPY